MTSPSWRRVAPVVAVAVATATSVVLNLRSPLWIVADAKHDDQLYARLAGSLVEGRWLGDFWQLTLPKGPGYPLFVAVAYQLHLPLGPAQHLVHLGAAAVAALAIARLARSRWAGVITYVALVLDPGYLGASGSRVSRDGFYGSLSLLLFGGVLLVLSGLPAVVRRGPRWWVPVSAAGGLVLGGTLGVYQLTREERAWLYPVLALGVAAGLASWRGRGRVSRPHLAALACVGLVAGLASFGTVRWAAERNDRFYGTTVTSDIAEGTIAEAFAQWQRVEAGPHYERVPVSRAQREAVYRVSPAARELAPELEALDNPWVGVGCTPRTCEYSGAFFAWAMRDAAETAGLTPTGGDAQRFFGEVAGDIEAACGDELRCTGPPIGPLPPLDRIDGGRLWSSTRAVTGDLLTYDVGSPDRDHPSGGTPDNWEIMVRPLRGVGGEADHAAAERRALQHQEAVSALEVLYRWGARLGGALALAGIVVGLVTGEGRRRLPLVLVALAAVLAVAIRVLIVALLDATAFDAVGIGVYVLPATSFLVLFVCVGAWLLGDVVRAVARGDRLAVAGGAPGDDDEDLAPVAPDARDEPRPRPGDPDRAKELL